MIRHGGSLGSGGVIATRSAVAVMSATAAARQAGGTALITRPAQLGCAASFRQVSCTISACLAAAVAVPPPWLSARSAETSAAASLVGLPLIFGTTFPRVMPAGDLLVGLRGVG